LTADDKHEQHDDIQMLSKQRHSWSKQ